MNEYVDGGDGYAGLCPSCADWAYGQDCTSCDQAMLEWNESANTLDCPSCSDAHAEEVRVRTPAGEWLCFESAQFRLEGVTYVRFENSDGEEVAYWHFDEWREAPEEVVGAILGCLVGGAESKDRQEPPEPPSYEFTQGDAIDCISLLRKLASKPRSD